MNVTHVVGVDPGLVHTGCVSLAFIPNLREINVEHEAIAGPDAAAVNLFPANAWGALRHNISYVKPSIFIEGYRPRSSFNTDKRMVEAVASIRKTTMGKVLDNTGVKKVVKQPLMELLGCWKFGTVTHHQDLRSAARIALLGMLRDEEMNRLIADVVRDHLNGRTWQVSNQLPLLTTNH